jgi:hypothetical protein
MLWLFSLKGKNSTLTMAVAILAKGVGPVETRHAVMPHVAISRRCIDARQHAVESSLS